MAYKVGTAVGSDVVPGQQGHYQLLSIIKNFLLNELPVGQRHIALVDETEGTGVGDNLPFRKILFKAFGTNQTENIYYGIKTYQSVSADYYNFQIDGFTGYIPGGSFETQPGSIYGSGLVGIGVTLWDMSIPYWLYGDADGFMCAVKIQSTYIVFGGGFIKAYATPGQYPYPLFIGGNLPTATATRYSVAFTNFFKGARDNCRLRFVDGSWLKPSFTAITNTNIYRNTNNNSNIAAGYYGLHPMELTLDGATGNYYGIINGIYFISGFDNSVESTVVVDGVTHIVIRDGTLTGHTDYIVLKLG